MTLVWVERVAIGGEGRRCSSLTSLSRPSYPRVVPTWGAVQDPRSSPGDGSARACLRSAGHPVRRSWRGRWALSLARPRPRAAAADALGGVRQPALRPSLPLSGTRSRCRCSLSRPRRCIGCARGRCFVRSASKSSSSKQARRVKPPQPLSRRYNGLPAPLALSQSAP